MNQKQWGLEEGVEYFEGTPGDHFQLGCSLSPAGADTHLTFSLVLPSLLRPVCFLILISSSSSSSSSLNLFEDRGLWRKYFLHLYLIFWFFGWTFLLLLLFVALLPLISLVIVAAALTAASAVHPVVSLVELPSGEARHQPLICVT